MYVLTISSIISKSSLNAKTSGIGTWKIVVAPADSILVKILHKKNLVNTHCAIHLKYAEKNCAN